MNLFNLIANGSTAKSPLTEANAGHGVARPDQTGLNQKEFSKYLNKLLDAKAQIDNLDVHRQDLADWKRMAAANPPSERPDRVARDARFDPPRSDARDKRDAMPSSTQVNDPARDVKSKGPWASRQSTSSPLNRRAELNANSAPTDAKEDVHAATEPMDPSAKGQVAESASGTPGVNDVSPVVGEPQTQGDGLVALQISPRIQVITTDTLATSDESLVAYARSMGMADSTIQQLLGKSAIASDLVSSNSTANLGGDPGQAGPSLAQASAWPAGSLLQSLMGRGAATLPSNPLTEGLSMSKTPPSETLPTLQAAMLEGIGKVSLQIGTGVAPAASAFATLPNSTLAVLSMLDAQLTPEAIDSLQKEFNAAPSEFADGELSNALSVGSFGAKIAAGGAHTPGASAVSTSEQMAHMAETYEKLSDKLATELASRLHQQISDGQWKMKFALKPASLGAVDIQLEMRDGKLAALFQADNPLTQDLLQNSSQRLKDALHNLGMSQTSVQVGQGHAQFQSNGQSQTSPDATKIGDNRGQTTDPDPNALADIGRRRASDSQFDIYA